MSSFLNVQAHINLTNHKELCPTSEVISDAVIHQLMEPKGSLPCSMGPSTSPYSEPDQFIPQHCILSLWSLSILFTNLRPFSILSMNLSLGLHSGLDPSGFPTNILRAIFFSTFMCYTSCPSHPYSFDHCNNTWWIIPVMKLLIMHFSPASFCFICLQYKYVPHHCSQTPSPYIPSSMSETKCHTRTEQQAKL
jgi:hypothetical protein